jgi:hypothetical protein
MRKLFSLLAFLPLLALGCSDDSEPAPIDAATIDASLLGTDCTTGATCGGYICAEGKCAATCTSTAGCGYNQGCYKFAEGWACVPITYGTAAGQYGTNCAVHGVADCATPYTCVQTNPDDADSYCATTCASDRDCPADYACLTAGTALRCTRRTLCSACEIDEQCQGQLMSGGSCEADTSATTYCTIPCAVGTKSCPGGFECDETSLTCKTFSGACKGDGTTCSPCTLNSDCVAGATCLRFTFSGELFCSEACTSSCTSPYLCSYNQCVPPDAWNQTCAPKYE